MPDRVLQVGVKAVIRNEQGQVLLLKKSYAHVSEKRPSWDIPGGRIKVGEPLLEALAREVTEETGLELVETTGLFHAQDILTNPELHVVRITYLISTCGEVTISDEHAEYRWFAQDQIPWERTDRFFVEAARANGWL